MYCSNYIGHQAVSVSTTLIYLFCRVQPDSDGEVSGKSGQVFKVLDSEETCSLTYQYIQHTQCIISGGFRNLERGVQPLAHEFSGCHTHFRSRWKSELNILKQL